MLYLGLAESPLSLVSSLSIQTDLRKLWMFTVACSRSFSGIFVMMSAVPRVRSLSSQTLWTISWTFSFANSVKPLMVNIKFGQGRSRGVTRNVIASEDQTLRASMKS